MLQCFSGYNIVYVCKKLYNNRACKSRDIVPDIAGTSYYRLVRKNVYM